jgi:phytoene synthase
MPTPSYTADLKACRAQLRHGSRSFFAASLLLPASVRNPATALYAFCRQADDAIDLGTDPKSALIELNARLDSAYAGTPAATPVDRAFAATVDAFNIPKALPAALIEGLTWDAEGRAYETFEQLQDYAARVAGTVGVMMSLIMGVRTAAALARAADLGVAMQLTNIARDVGEDARAGRLFLPLDWLAQAGIDPTAFLANPQACPALRSLVRRLLAEAQTLYSNAKPGIALLPWNCRTGIGAAHRIYAAIGEKIATANHDSITLRARVTGTEKLTLALAAAAAIAASPPATTLPPLPANQFLINAAAIELPTEPASEPGAVTKLLLMFERLERTQREASTSRLTA